MKSISFSFRNVLVSKEEIFETAEKLTHEVENMVSVISKGYDDERAFINLPSDRDMLSKVEQMVKEKSRVKPEYLVVVGIGGSNLGTMAVQEAVFGKLHNQISPSVKVLWADTVDSDFINSIAKIVESTLREGKNIILNAISKSGTTTETAVNFEVLLDLLKKHKEDYAKYVVITTDKDSEFWNLSLDEGFSVLEIPEKVVGRYSVFSSVGLFPLGLLGINVEQLLAGARSMRDLCLNKNVEKNPATITAAIQYLHYKGGKNISDLFLFSNDLESLGKWYRQLLAESLGKEFNKEGKRVHVGVTPTVSIGSTDLHSVAQLYLGGPYDKFTTFVKVEKTNSRIYVPKGFPEIVPGTQGKSLQDIMNAILEGTKRAFRNSGRPFVEITLPDKSEYAIGQFLQFKMMETVFLGYLLGINPFDQPNVESYKLETRKILARKTS